jgi:hypothetical protein
MEILFVKTAKAAYEHGFVAALESEGFAVHDKIHMDAVRACSHRLHSWSCAICCTRFARRHTAHGTRLHPPHKPAIGSPSERATHQLRAPLRLLCAICHQLSPLASTWLMAFRAWCVRAGPRVGHHCLRAARARPEVQGRHEHTQRQGRAVSPA